jgi:SAM-dependent methyltransferase
MAQEAVTKDEAMVGLVRDRYGKIASGALPGCCGPAPASCGEPLSIEVGYDREALGAAPEGADLGLGCGAPIRHLALQPGETVLDLGSGAGLDVFLAADAVGPGGRAIGVDMTPEMLERARAGAARAGIANVEFREGRLEALPLPDASVDAVTSNCVINLVPDKRAVFREVARVLRPGGRLVISDIVLDGRLPEAVERDVLAYVGCIAGAAERADYFALVREAGLTSIEVLRDFDFLDSAAGTLPEETQALLARAGVRKEEILGRVRSITFRAVKEAR